MVDQRYGRGASLGVMRVALEGDAGRGHVAAFDAAIADDLNTPVALTVAAALTDAGETVHRIGRIEAGPRGCTVRGPDESWSARGAWSATHNYG